MNRLVTGLATGTLLALTACSSPEQGPSAAELRQYQEALAAPYAGCAISNVVSVGEKPPTLVNERELRETVSMKVTFTKTDEAKEAQEVYADDDHFVWQHTLGGELSQTPDGPKYPVAERVTNDVGDDEKEYRLGLYPRKKLYKGAPTNFYKDGATIDIHLRTDVWGDGTELVVASGDPDKTTKKLCGRLVLSDGRWIKAPGK